MSSLFHATIFIILAYNYSNGQMGLISVIKFGTVYFSCQDRYPEHSTKKVQVTAGDHRFGDILELDD